MVHSASTSPLPNSAALTRPGRPGQGGPREGAGVLAGGGGLTRPCRGGILFPQNSLSWSRSRPGLGSLLGGHVQRAACPPRPAAGKAAPSRSFSPAVLQWAQSRPAPPLTRSSGGSALEAPPHLPDPLPPQGQRLEAASWLDRHGSSARGEAARARGKRRGACASGTLPGLGLGPRSFRAQEEEARRGGLRGGLPAIGAKARCFPAEAAWAPCLVSERHAA